MYVHKKVWESNAMEMGTFTQQHAPQAAIEVIEQLSGVAALTTLR